MKYTYQHTKYACYTGYITQAIINNLSPLLFVIFQDAFGLTLPQITLLITLNFAVQMTVDLLCVRFIEKAGYRKSIVLAHFCAAAGLVGICLFPLVMPAFMGLIIAAVISAVGGGLLEVLVSPIIEAIPGDKKESEMSLLHSFYCWGVLAVVLLSTGFFVLFGKQNWRALPLLWAIVPLLNAFFFQKVPVRQLVEDGQEMPLLKLLKTPVFWLFCVMMTAAGASELAMSQWASLFAEEGLGVSKTVGDLMGPCCFAILMGTSRILFSRAKKMTTQRALLLSSLLCICCYLVTVFAPSPFISLIGCAVCGFSVGVMWPGVFSLSSARLPTGGTKLFAFLAMFGDIGCCLGPSVVGLVSDGVLAQGASFLFPGAAGEALSQAALKTGFSVASLFPLLLMAGVMLLTAAAMKGREKNMKEM
ncbi:MAG: MFS transporter [Clostridia bacterium]|nr:MFS transporter [Clostridia bacterium]